MRAFALAAILAAALAAAMPAAAEPSSAVLKKVGVTGVWAPTCGAPASMENWTSHYFDTSDGRANFRSDRGKDAPTVITTVDEAAILTPTTIRWKLRYNDPKWGQLNGTAFSLVSEIIGKRMRTLTSTLSDGKVLIRDGKLVANGEAIPYENKCSD